ncbi:bowman-birk serine protease inhibitor family protein (macronuclear) [Tetrahymena thermophila SB210]|uniref:Bowman-birk serine protease inhibitor family protein n=1 Tax=Tetrahymena thermophila (strain SB210) TaxID=312017 RepID=Q22KL3_TETTS|nr:bowman-birk serine protease inhibitor family protein [Tetrahymena thermophila SB210]EAR85786.2 bowman-birk serine protease inhibitor family protein [Tetrahymena thermophila SB210]|eukprot:XP_001033449.2 bowman-birk serine protease inhibitor family protein [Tetrahymena thermophila SB210]
MTNYFLKLIFLYQIIVFVYSLQPYSNIQRKQLTHQYVIQPCQVQPDEVAYTTQFSTLFPNANQAQNLTISGWFLLYGYQSNNYVIFSVHEQNQSVMALLVNLKDNQFIFNLLGTNGITQNTQIKANRWFFMVVTLSCISGNIQVNGGAYFYNSYINLSGMSKAYQNSYLQLQNMEFNSGNPPQRLNIQPSCSLYKQLAILIDSYNSIQSTSKIEDYLAKQESSLIMHYDYFYSQQNPGKLLSDVGTKYQMLNIQDQLQNNTICSTNHLDTQTIELEGLNEFIFSFFIKFEKIASFNFLTLLLPNYLVTFTQYFNFIQFGSAQVQFDISKWVQVIIHYSQYSTAPLSLIISGYEQNMQSISFTAGTQVAQLKFKQDSNNKYQLNHIRIYKGSLIYSNQNCFLQSADGSCILCKQNYLLDFQNDMSCVIKSQINTDTEINGIKDWNPPRKICPLKMVSDNSSPDGCKCIAGYYLQGQQCVLCPSYCRQCSNPNDCNLTRDSSGNCLDPKAFDDGNQCILPFFIIPQNNKFRYVMKKPDFGQTCSNMDVQSKYQYYGSNFNLQQDDSFFFSFTLSVMSLNGKINKTTLAWIKQSSIFLLEIILKYVSDTNGVPLLTVQFNIKNKFFKDYVFFISDPAWIGFWTDNYNYLLIFRSNQINNQFQFTDTDPFFSSPDLQFCIGYCDQLINGCLSLLSNSITFIRNLQYSTQQGIDQMFSLYQDDSPLIGIYKFDQKYSNFLKEIVNSGTNNPSVKLIFSQNLQKYNKYQGFQISQSVQATLTYSSNSYGITTISLNLEIDSDYQFSQFLFINLSFLTGGYSFQVFLVPDYLQNVIRVRLCFDSQCFSTQQAVLLFDQSNFFFFTFIADLKQMYKQYVLLYKVDVVCNYILEKFTFASQKTNFQLGLITFGSNTSSFQIFLDNINIYSQNGFVYYDLTQTDPCHIYINISNTKCLHLKRQYLYFNNTIITQQKCSQLSKTTQNIPVINLKDQTCDLIIPLSPTQYLCGNGQYIKGQFVCTLCKDINANPLKQCLQCKSHFFYDKITQVCQECDQQCQECVDNSSQCTQCQYINQITPSCDCISQPLKGQNSCQCNYKCGSCSYLNSDSCITCSSDKRVMPNCLCDSQYVEVNNECISLNCSSKCQSCNLNANNCNKCSVNRINPPLCNCMEGFQEDQNGVCQPCPTGTFFDPNLKNCQSCSSQCLFCNQKECLQCADEFEKQGSQCVCQNQLLYYLDQKNVLKCLKMMDLYLKSSKQNNKQLIKFIFDKNLLKFNLENIALNKIVKVYIPEIPETYYDVINPIYDLNTFQLEIKINQNFYATLCVVIIIKNQFFISDDESFILGDSYVNFKMNVGIGPLVLKDENLDNLHLDKINGQLSEFKQSNSGIFQIINQFQIVFYLLNTLQPISLFLLLDVIYPPQLYKLYQFIGNFVFPQVPDYLDEPSYSNFRILGFQIDGVDSKQPNFGKFKNYGFCLSLLVNIPLAVIKYFVLFSSLLLTITVQLRLFYKNNLVQKIKIFLIQRINSDNEVSLSIITICCFIQFIEINQDSYIYRQGFYLALMFLSMQIVLFYFNYQNVTKNKSEGNEYSILFTERLKCNSTPLQKSYFLIQNIKKYLYVLIVCSLFNYPLTICITCGILFLISALLTAYMTPYHNKLSRSVKFLGEIALSVTWFLHIPLLSKEQIFKSQAIIEDSDLKQYLDLGNVILGLLLAYNLLFFVQLLYDLYKYVDNFLKKKKLQNQTAANNQSQLSEMQLLKKPCKGNIIL